MPERRRAASRDRSAGTPTLTSAADVAYALGLRHQLPVLQRHVGPREIQSATSPRERANSSRPTGAVGSLALPVALPDTARLLVRPDTVLKWQRDIIARRHAAVSRPRRPGPALNAGGETRDR